jgi:hypothetical protein
MAENSRFKKATIQDFSKGLVSNYGNRSLSDKQFPLMKNVDLNRRGSLVRRLGYKDIMPDLVPDGKVQAYIDFSARPYSIDEVSQQFQFQNHTSPKETDLAINSKLIAIDGKIYLVDLDTAISYDYRPSFNFNPVKRNWQQEFLTSEDGSFETFNNELGEWVSKSSATTNTNILIYKKDAYSSYDTSIRDLVFKMDYKRYYYLEDGTTRNDLEDLIEKYKILGYDYDYHYVLVEMKISYVYNSTDEVQNIYLRLTLEKWNETLESYETLDLTDGNILIDEIEATPSNPRGEVNRSIELAYDKLNDAIDIKIYDTDTDTIILDYESDKFEIGGVKVWEDLDLPTLYEPDFTVSFYFDPNSSPIELSTKNFVLEYDNDGGYDTQSIGSLVYPMDEINNVDAEHSLTNFQTDDLIEYTILGNNCYIATGSKVLCLRYVLNEYYRVVLLAQEVDKIAYEPNTQEVAIGGLNLILEDPFESVNDFENGATYQVDLVRTKDKFGISNVDNIIKAFCTILFGKTIEDYDFKFEAQKETTDDLSVFDIEISEDFINGETGRKTIINFAEPGKYNIRVTMRNKDNGDTSLYKYGFMYGYEVSNVDKNKDIDITSTSGEINSCKRIIQYYNKIILYDNGTRNIYKSFSGKDTWFSVSGVIPLNALRQEFVRKIIPLDNALLGFTKNSIVALIGKGDDIEVSGYPYEPFFKFITLESNIGAYAPDSVVKTNDGRLIFLAEEGLHVTENIDLSSEYAKTYKIDEPVDNLVVRDEEATAIIYNNKYYICFPNQTRILKFHFTYNNVFTMDESSELVFSRFYKFDDILYAIDNRTIENKLYEHQRIINSTVDQLDELSISNQGYFKDVDEVFEVEIETKYLSFEYEEYLKKLYEFSIDFNSLVDEQLELYINVLTDNVPILGTTDGELEFSDNGDTITGYSRIENDLDNQIPNALGDKPIKLNDFILGENRLGFFAQTFRYFEIMDSTEAMGFKLVLKHKQDTYLLIAGFSFIFEIGYIPKDSNYRL